MTQRRVAAQCNQSGKRLTDEQTDRQTDRNAMVWGSLREREGEMQNKMEEGSKKKNCTDYGWRGGAVTIACGNLILEEERITH